MNHIQNLGLAPVILFDLVLVGPEILLGDGGGGGGGGGQ